MLHEVPICFVGEDPELTGCRNLGPLVDQSPTERGGARATRMRLLHKMSPKIHVEETAVLRKKKSEPILTAGLGPAVEWTMPKPWRQPRDLTPLEQTFVRRQVMMLRMCMPFFLALLT